METRVNKDLVTHIEIISAKKSKYKWCDEIKLKRVFFNSITVCDAYEEGFWEDGIQGFFQERLDTDVFKSFTEIDGVVWWNPYLSVFCGNTKVHGKHYATVEEIREICDKEFPHVNLTLK